MGHWYVCIANGDLLPTRKPFPGENDVGAYRGKHHEWPLWLRLTLVQCVYAAQTTLVRYRLQISPTRVRMVLNTVRRRLPHSHLGRSQAGGHCHVRSTSIPRPPLYLDGICQLAAQTRLTLPKN
jgi:hypothetical protein